MQFFYQNLLLFAQFNSEVVADLTKLNLRQLIEHQINERPNFDNLLQSNLSIGAGTNAFAMLAVYSAISRLSATTMMEKIKKLFSLDSYQDLRGFDFDRTIDFPTNLSRDDYSFWLRKDRWSLDEMILLSIGLRPEKQVIEDFKKITYSRKMSSGVISAYTLRKKLAEVEYKKGRFEHEDDSELCEPLKCVQWLKVAGMDTPDQWVNDVKDQCIIRDYQKRETTKVITTAKHVKAETAYIDTSNHGRISEPSQVNDEISPKEMTSLLTLIHAMSKTKPYLYDPDKPRNGAIDRIYLTILDSGLNLSKRTIKKYMSQAWDEADRLKDKNQ